jgi:tyrosyl-tRNA synthetase
MSKSYGNAVGLAEPPAEIFGKIMSIPDELMPKYFRLATDLEPAEVDAVISGLASGVLHPGATKRRLAREIVALFHSPEAAHAAEQRFDTQFVTRGIPEGIDEFDLGEASEWFLPSLLVAAGLCPSTSDARRHVRARAVRIDGAIQTDETAMLRSADVEGRVLQVGKRRFRRLVRRS